MKHWIVYGGSAVVWLIGFSSAVYAASQGAHVNIAHAFIFGNLAAAGWFLVASIVNLNSFGSKITRR